MKHLLRRSIALFMVLLLQLFLFTSASAATVTRNGLQLDFSTDKESYAIGDSVQCTVDVTNNSQQELSVSYDVILPEGLEETVAQRAALVVGSEEQQSASFALLAVGKGADGVPSTGDSFPLAMAGVLFVAAAAACFVLFKNKKRFTAFMMVFMLAFGMASPLLETSAVAEAKIPVNQVFNLSEMNGVAEKHSGYEEDAFQTVYTDEISEEDYELQLDEAEQRVLAAQGDDFVAAGETVDEFSLTHNIYVEGQLAAIRVNVVVTNAVDASDVAAKATLATVKLDPITILGTTKFTLKWKAVAGATHYEVWHLYNGSYIKKTTTTALTYTTNYGNAGVINTYKVRAIKKSGNTTIAKGAYATRTCYGMNKPTIVSVGHTSSTSEDVRIRWNAGSFCTGYHVYRSFSGETGTYTRIGSSSGTSFVDYYRNGYYKLRPYYIGKNGIEYMGPATPYKAMAPQYRALLIQQNYDEDPLIDGLSMGKMLISMTNPKYRAVDTYLGYDVSWEEMIYGIKMAFQRAKNNDVSLFYYSGGVVNTSGWLAGYHVIEGEADYLTIDELRQALDTVPGKKIVILDSSYSGAYINKAGSDTTFISEEEFAKAYNDEVIRAFSSGTTDKANLAASGYYVLTSCSKSESALVVTRDGLHYSMFTHSVVWGSGYQDKHDTFGKKVADTNNDNKLSLKELCVYANAAMDAYASELGRATPNVQMYPTNSNFICWGN